MDFMPVKKRLVVKEFLDGQSNHIGAVSRTVHANTSIEQCEVFLGDSKRNGTGGLAHPVPPAETDKNSQYINVTQMMTIMSLSVIHVSKSVEGDAVGEVSRTSRPSIRSMSLVPTRGLFLYLETIARGV